LSATFAVNHGKVSERKHRIFATSLEEHAANSFFADSILLSVNRACALHDGPGVLQFSTRHGCFLSPAPLSIWASAAITWKRTYPDGVPVSLETVRL
jgi:hypothetical protein